MRYNIESVIKRLREAQRKGKDIIDEAELIKIATPQINDIDGQLQLLERGIEKLKKRNSPIYENTLPIIVEQRLFDHISFTDAENLTGIPRQTFYRWEKDGILQRRKRIGAGSALILQELKEAISKIKQAKG